MHVRLLRAKDDNRERFVYYPPPVAEVVELVDTTDSKSVAYKACRFESDHRYH